MNFLQTVLAYEAQGINREALTSLIKPELEAIDAKRKDFRESCEKDIKAVGAIDATKACNAVCPTIPGSDNAARQRLSRRRNWLKGLLKKIHGKYDFTMADGQLFCEYIGDSITREANELLLVIQRLNSLDIITAEITRDDIIAGLKSETASSGANVIEVDSTTVKSIATVLARVSAISENLGTTNEEASQEDQEEKQA